MPEWQDGIAVVVPGEVELKDMGGRRCVLGAGPVAYCTGPADTVLHNRGPRPVTLSPRRPAGGIRRRRRIRPGTHGRQYTGGQDATGQDRKECPPGIQNRQTRRVHAPEEHPCLRR